MGRPTGIGPDLKRVANLQAKQFGQEDVPLSMPATPEDREALVSRMAGRIVQTHLSATPVERLTGERFYSHDAHGAARSMAMGINPNSGAGTVTRMMGKDRAASDNRLPGITAMPRGETQSIYDGPHGDAHRAAADDWQARGTGPEYQQRLHQAAGVLAKTSPQTEWSLNIRQAHEAWNMRDENPQMLSQLATDDRDYSRPKMKGRGKSRAQELDKQGNPKFNRIPVRSDSTGEKMDLNSKPTRDILASDKMAHGDPTENHVATDDIHRVKIGSFQRNIEDPYGSPDTTVDFRAHDIAVGKPYQTSAERGLSQDPKSKSRGDAGNRYDIFQEAHERAAGYVSAHHADTVFQSEPLQPKQIQATTWWADKDFQDGELGGEEGVQGGGHLHRGADGKGKSRDDLPKPVGQPANRYGK